MLGKAIPLALLAATLVGGGCKVEHQGSDDHEKVKIETPMGALKVNTNQATVTAETGLSVYPGATAESQENGHSAGDVAMNFGSFHLRFKTVSYRTPDLPDKVKDYYRKELARYGDVIECRDNHAVGTPSRTREGLTCDHTDSDAKAEIELKAGSEHHQHMVGIEPQSGGTKFALVALDLPFGEKQSN